MADDLGKADPWRRVSGPQQTTLLATISRYSLWHWIRQPYQLGRPAKHAGSAGSKLLLSARSAVYDSVINHFLNGYAELADCRLRPETGPLVILLYRLMAAFDDEYECRVREGGSMEFGAILKSAPVQMHMDALSRFLADHPERHAIRDFLEGYAADNYKRYLALTRSSGTAGNISHLIEMVELDSGGFLVCTAHVIGIFNRHAPTADIIAEFAHLGVVGKLADDMVDVWSDYREDVANILSGVCREYPEEYRVLAAHAEAAPRVGYRWWRARCPRSFALFTEILATHRSALSARSLGVAGDLMLLPAAWGGPATRPAATERGPGPS
ncbi:hypothetical protein OG788_46795 [Streptomyces sp. NBC_00647]|uniref:hypothetical protein n=1 Tax=Streptomyces sp. NBC_00647 TaxID=2975796 RepID=UPI00324586CC